MPQNKKTNILIMTQFILFFLNKFDNYYTFLAGDPEGLINVGLAVLGAWRGIIFGEDGEGPGEGPGEAPGEAPPVPAPGEAPAPIPVPAPGEAPAPYVDKTPEEGPNKRRKL